MRVFKNEFTVEQLAAFKEFANKMYSGADVLEKYEIAKEFEPEELEDFVSSPEYTERFRGYTYVGKDHADRFRKENRVQKFFITTEGNLFYIWKTSDGIQVLNELKISCCVHNGGFHLVSALGHCMYVIRKNYDNTRKNRKIMAEHHADSLFTTL